MLFDRITERWWFFHIHMHDPPPPLSLSLSLSKDSDMTVSLDCESCTTHYKYHILQDSQIV